MKLEKKISLKYPVGFKLGKNPVHQTRYFKLENWKNPVQIDRETVFIDVGPEIPLIVFFCQKLIGGFLMDLHLSGLPKAEIFGRSRSFLLFGLRLSLPKFYSKYSAFGFVLKMGHYPFFSSFFSIFDKPM